MRPELLTKIKQLVYDGAIVLGQPPKRSPSLQNQPEADIQVKNLADELWSEVNGSSVKIKKHGKGLIINGLSMEEVFEELKYIPDCKLPEDNTIHYGHRTLKNGTEIYFVSNQADKEQIINPEFRVKEMKPELWNAVTGEIRELPSFEHKENITSVPLKLAPFESVFIVFNRKTKKVTKSANIEKNYPEPELITELTSNWTVTFDSERQGPAEPVLFEKLYDWTASDNEKIKYYSGTAVYSNAFNIENFSENNNISIDLGNLTAMGKVYINGEYAGGVWTPPYRLNISTLVKEGLNEIKIEVVNNWKNRIIGDMNLPENQRSTWCFVNPYNKNSELQPSGLFGPVKIMLIKN